MKYSLKYLFVISICILFSLDANSQVKNNKLACPAKHLDTNQDVETNIISGLATKKIATAQWPLGYPTIAIDYSAFSKLPVNAKQFIYYHECAHLQLRTDDENIADCHSVKLMTENQGISLIDLRRLIQTLTKELGWSRRWHELLNCESVPEK